MNPQPDLHFSIKTPVFEGPLELLLDLVEKRKLLINDISLASVTDEYMRQVSLMQELSLPNTAQFINLAATLLLVKSKSLLPVLTLSDEEEQSIEDLEERLRHYQIIREGTEAIKNTFGRQISYAPQFKPPQTPLFLPDHYCSINELHSAMIDALQALPKKDEPKRATVKSVITLEEMMAKLEARINQNLRTRFFELHQNEPERKTIIVSFLAILELFKQGNVLVTQGGRFADIEIERDQARTPTYY